MREIAIVDGGILLVRVEVVGSGPMVGSSRLSVGSQADVIVDAIGTVIVDQGRQDAAVGRAVAAGFAEVDVTSMV